MMFNDNDKAMHAGLMKLLNEGTFELKAKEVPAFLKIYNWTMELAKPKHEFDPKKVEPIKKKKKANKKA